MKKILGTMLCMVIIFLCFSFSSAETVVPSSIEDAPKEFLQYFVKWDDELAPGECFSTEAEYLTTLSMDKNGNGIWDVLEEEEEEEDVVRAAAAETGILSDLNGDMFVDNRDAVLMYRHVAGWDQDINSRVLDFNGDGYVNIGDANHLMKYVSGWPNTILYKGMKYDIIYHVLTEGMYQEAQVYNVNQDYYYSSDGLTLKNITADGYIFEGWYDGEGENATRIRKIEVGETGEIDLYARWTPRTYRIDFDSALVEVPTKYYTIETGSTLTNPSLSNYIFVGWTVQEDGRLVNGIPKGTFGNLVLVANWASRRNIAKPVQRLGEPVIAEDDVNGRIMFIYKIGDIENVPLFTLYRYSTAQGIVTSVTTTEQRSISTSDARTISETVAKATTDSATWTLSEGWNESTSISQETLQQQGLTREEAETIAKTTSNTYRMDTTESYSDVITDSSQYAYKGTIGTGTTAGQTTTTSSNFKYSVDASIGVEASAEAEVKAPGVGSVKSGVKATETLSTSAEAGGSMSHSGTTTNSWNKTLEEAGQASTAKTSTKNWNSSSSYSNSNSLSNTRTTSQQISEIVSDKWGYGSSYSKNGAQSSGQAFSTENSQQNAYSNTVTYNSSTLYTQQVTISTDGKIDGYFRQVIAGTAHVFGVVGYDVATRSYFAYTFTVMDDEVFEFLDYSKNTSNFNDNEISVIPFEIPSFVNDYVNSRIARTGGLQINLSGEVTAYTGNEKIVFVPNYWDIDNGDGTYTSVKVTSINSNAFKNNTDIEGVMLSDFTTAIPDSAFEGCTSLKDVYVPNLTSIGSRAFYGCTSLSAITIPTDVVSLGNNAFHNVSEVVITAANKNIALVAMNSGAKNLVLNISSINTQMKDAVLEAPATMSSFELRGERKQYENLRIKSNAAATTINGVSFVNCSQIPLELHSATVNLNQTNVSASGYCMILAENTCNLNLFGTNQMTSSSGGAIVCGTTALANINSSVQAILQVSGNIYVYGSLKNQDKYLNQTSGSIISITQEQFNQYISGVYKLIYDANGGSVSENEKTGYSGVAVGTLPTPTWTGYTFAGWYTAASGGTQVTSSSTFISSSSVTIYAHWTANKYTVSFNANGGESVSPNSKEVMYGSTYGTLATAKKAGYSLDGWYTSENGGTKIIDSTKVVITSSQTLYAHWTLNPESGWVTENQVPTNAIITQTSWSYRESRESTSSTLDGYTPNGSYEKTNGSGSKEYASFPDGFNTGHWTYTSLSGSAYSSSGTKGVGSWREVSNSHAGWVYYHWAYNAAYYAVTNRTIASHRVVGKSDGFGYYYFYAIKSTVDCPSLGTSPSYVLGSNGNFRYDLTQYDCGSIIPGDADKSSTSGLNNNRFLRVEYFSSTYTDKQMIYKFYKDVHYSATDPGTGFNISNKVKYVKYRDR